MVYLGGVAPSCLEIQVVLVMMKINDQAGIWILSSPMCYRFKESNLTPYSGKIQVTKISVWDLRQLSSGTIEFKYYSSEGPSHNT